MWQAASILHNVAYYFFLLYSIIPMNMQAKFLESPFFKQTHTPPPLIPC